MSGRRSGRAIAAALLLTAAGCLGRPEPTPVPVAAPSPWDAVLDSTRRLVAERRYATADTLLDAFAVRSAGTPPGAEATFWRAVLALDPENPEASPRDALVAVDRYLAGGALQARYVEALILRRAAEALEAARTRPAPPPPIVAPTDTLARLRAVQDSVRELRAELERTQAELERIKRRIRP